MNGLTQFLTNAFEGLHDWIITLFNMEPSGVSYVLTIAIFTLIIRLLILPLNIKSSRSSARMQEIQPQLNAIQKKYANDPKKMQEEYNKCLKENNASMFGGCLPSLLPLPILFALYAVFNSISPDAMKSASFLWIPNVFEKDPIFILPVLAFLSTYLPTMLLSKATPKTENGPNMGSMNIMMAGMMGIMALNFKAILVIYWVIGGVIQLIQTYFVNYLPAKKKQKEKEELEKYKVMENAKKATPKTRKR
ncbi:membrane protein insertase YidC [Clostridium isatidis]|uniref:Membrane protein insertase YidC n=1 Tax=Clostridium isatidis TaxID=182773 RepID=A0A343JFV7_9CLOT|nr:membrane protein insertase YidC [Clostridium isatidis]ASW44415.1 membrane protein insertase YidC [Clostridium isatidis]NLZ34354.1 membrane protein insertase YidC [Clostridiales bacterium]